MTISLYAASVPVFQQMLNALSDVLKKAEAHATEKNIDPNAFLQARLYPDMFPLTRQVQIAVDFAKGVSARLAEVELPKYDDSETTFAENIQVLPALIPPLRGLLAGLAEDLANSHAERVIRSLVVKMKFADFHRTTAERAGQLLDPAIFEELLAEAWKRGNNRAVRLLGVGVRFEDPRETEQMEFFA